MFACDGLAQTLLRNRREMLRNDVNVNAKHDEAKPRAPQAAQPQAFSLSAAGKKNTTEGLSGGEDVGCAGCSKSSESSTSANETASEASDVAEDSSSAWNADDVAALPSTAGISYEDRLAHLVRSLADRMHSCPTQPPSSFMGSFWPQAQCAVAGCSWTGSSEKALCAHVCQTHSSDFPCCLSRTACDVICTSLQDSISTFVFCFHDRMFSVASYRCIVRVQITSF